MARHIQKASAARRPTMVPRERGTGVPPRQRAVAAPPAGSVPAPRASHPPPERELAAPPNPRRPALVRDVHGNELKDLFELFPDLPRPRRLPSPFPVRLSRALKLR